MNITERISFKIKNILNAYENLELRKNKILNFLVKNSIIYFYMPGTCKLMARYKNRFFRFMFQIF